jgi:hypothetical protein
MNRRTPASLAATSMARVVVALAWWEVAGSSTDRATLGMAAW